MRTATVGSAALATLFLILAAVVAAISPVTKGFAVRTAVNPDTCDDDARQIVVTVMHDGAFRLNGQNVSRDELDGWLTKIMKFRAERVVFVEAEGGVAFKAVADVIDIASPHADHIGLFTRSIHRQTNYCLTINVMENLR